MKRSTRIILGTMLMLSLTIASGCGVARGAATAEVASPSSVSAPSVENTVSIDNNVSSVTVTSVEQKEKPIVIEEPAVIEPTYVNHCITQFEPFSEGMAWVEYETVPHGAIRKWGLIDESGVIKCITDTAGTPVCKGYTAACSEEALSIFDKDGNVSFYFTNTPEDSFELLTNDEDQFIVIEHVTGFSGNNYYLYNINYKGEPVNEKIDVTNTRLVTKEYGWDNHNSYVDYLGEGIFHLCPSSAYTYLYIPSTNVFYEMQYAGYISAFYEDKAILTLSTGLNNGPASISLNDLCNEEAFRAWEQNATFFKEAYNHNGYDICGEGIFYDYWTDGFYDYDINYLYPLIDYGEEVNINDSAIRAFSGGYTFIPMTGADGYPYITIIDKTGTPMFDPICLGKDKDPLYVEPPLFKNGRYYYRLDYFTDTYAVRCISHDGSYRDYYIEGEKQWMPKNADDKYMYYRGYAISLDGGWNIHYAREQVN